MHKYYEYAYQISGENVVCVCAATDGRQWARGVAVCAYEDTPDDERGAALARRYAERALKGRGGEKITDPRAIGRVRAAGCPWTFHSELEADLSFQEIRKLFGRKGLPEPVKWAVWSTKNYLADPFSYEMTKKFYSGDYQLFGDAYGR